MPRLIKTNKISAEISKGPFLDIGTKKKFEKSKFFLKRNFKNKAVLLDRDGVIIEDKGYVGLLKDTKLLLGVEKFRVNNKKKFFIFVITNQSGIGRGYYKVSYEENPLVFE